MLELLHHLRRRTAFRLFAAVIVIGLAARADAHHRPPGEELDNPVVREFLRELPPPITVDFPWRPGRFNHFKVGAEEEAPPTARQGRLAGQLYRAPGAGAAPYAVLLSGCGGTYEGVNGLWIRLWARALRDIGVGALAVDSFDVRGVTDGVCGEGAKTWAQRRIDDAHSALAWLATQPFVDDRRIIVMGMSNGAQAALLSVSARESWRLRQFAAAVALYPICGRMPPHALAAPSLLLLGEADEDAPAAACAAFAGKRAAVGATPRIEIYPGAGHLFDAYPRNEDYHAPEVLAARATALAFLGRVLRLERMADRPATTAPR